MLGKGSDFRSGASFAAIQTDWQAHDEGPDVPQLHQAGDALDGDAFTLIDGLDRVRENAEVIGRSYADPCIAVIDA